MVKGGIHGVGCASASHGARIMCFKMMKRVKVNGVGDCERQLHIPPPRTEVAANDERRSSFGYPVFGLADVGKLARCCGAEWTGLVSERREIRNRVDQKSRVGLF